MEAQRWFDLYFEAYSFAMTFKAGSKEREIWVGIFYSCLDIANDILDGKGE